MMLPDTAARRSASCWDARPICINAACATGSNTIGEAASRHRRVARRTMLAGGRAGIVPLAVAGFSVMGRPPLATTRRKAPAPVRQDRDGSSWRRGVVLESKSTPRRGAHLRRCYGIATTRITSSFETARAVTCAALKQARLPDDIDHLTAHGTARGSTTRARLRR
jgi:3-oxoacyl-(acyl-carrier-protein) synthase